MSEKNNIIIKVAAGFDHFFEFFIIESIKVLLEDDIFNGIGNILGEDQRRFGSPGSRAAPDHKGFRQKLMAVHRNQVRIRNPSCIKRPVYVSKRRLPTGFGMSY